MAKLALCLALLALLSACTFADLATLRQDALDAHAASRAYVEEHIALRRALRQVDRDILMMEIDTRRLLAMQATQKGEMETAEEQWKAIRKLIKDEMPRLADVKKRVEAFFADDR